MKRVIWANKSNGQLCVTIPKIAGLKAGDIVNIEKYKVNTVVYTPVTADLFHYGQLQLLEHANEFGDLHIGGVLTDEAVASYKAIPVASYKERHAIISALRCVDMVMSQHELDPTKNLKQLHEQFRDAKIVLVYGSNWKEVPGAEFIQEIGGEIKQPQFYEKLSTERVLAKITRQGERK